MPIRRSGVASAFSAAAAPSTSYTTSFAGADENPLSEGGNWAKAANAWEAVQRVGGVARPAGLNSGYNDAYSLCQVLAPVDAEVIITVDRLNSGAGEYEILLRAASSTTQTTGYEFLCNTGGAVQIVRWNGALGDFLDITGATNSPGNLATGNQLRATAVGSTLTFYHRSSSGGSWVQIGSASDSTFTSGRAGISFFKTTGTYTDLGITYFELNTL